MQDHLRPVPTGDESTEPPVQPKARAPQRPRPSKPLPTDRMKFDSALLALKAIVLDSANGSKAVGAQEIAKRLTISAATAGLNNAFFTEAGFITREGKGRWKPTRPAIEFARVHSFDRSRAGQALRAPLRTSWYFQEVEQQLAMGPTTVRQMVEVLAHVAGATADHQPQLRLILDWLEYAGLVDTQGDKVTLANPPDEGEPPPTPEPDDEHDAPPAGSADPMREGTTTQAKAQPTAETVLSLNFDFSLSGADLATLSPEQIRAVFEAVGRVAAIKAGSEP